MMARYLRRWWPLCFLALLPFAWLLPERQVSLGPAGTHPDQGWPQIWLQPAEPEPGTEATIWVRDREPWTFVQVTVNGRNARWGASTANPDGTWTWHWTFTAPESATTEYVFYHSCNEGCVERGALLLDENPAGSVTEGLLPTKLCTVFPDPLREWHGRSGWGVELTYAHLGDAQFWGVDDLATRVREATNAGVRVLVRVDYDQDQSVPPAGDSVALDEYLRYLERLARDERLRAVYGFIIASGYNVASNDRNASGTATPPEWYARLFNGYGEPLSHDDNVAQRLHAVNPLARVFVGPVQPWSEDISGHHPYDPDLPWLSYFNTVTSLIDEAARSKSTAGVPLAAPDGFALHAPGNPEEAIRQGYRAEEEPALSLEVEGEVGAEAGFGVYTQWLDIINAYPTTRGLPTIISSTNTYRAGSDTPPAQNYPRGWLTTALEEVNREPQLLALCWFIDRDRSGDARWNLFSLARRSGRLLDADEEFDDLLQLP